MSDVNLSPELFSRMEKLLAMANHAGSNENEAAIASAKLQSMLAEHNFKLAQIMTHSKKAGGKVDTGAREQKTVERAAMYKYQRELMGGIAKNNFCMYLGTREADAMSFGKMRRVKRHVILGRTVNVVAATVLYDYLVDTMDRLLPYTGMEKRGKEALYWLEGCAERLVERLEKQRAEMEAATKKKTEEEAARAKHPSAAPTGGNALIVLSDVYANEEELNRDFREGLEPGTTTRERLKDEAEAAARKARFAELKAQGVKWDVAWWMIVHNMTKEQAEAREAQSQIEADEQAKRDTKKGRRSRSSGGYRGPSWTKKDKREHDKVNSGAYKSGQSTGGSIGLNKQVTEKKQGRLG